MENKIDALKIVTTSLSIDEKQAMLAAIVSSTDDAIISKTLDGIVTSWNPAAEKMFGYTEAETVGKHISLIIPLDRLEEETFILLKVTQGEKVDHFETVRRAKNGNLVPLSLTISPICNRDGKIIGASKIARDISERQKADEKQAMLSAIVETSDDAIISKTLEGTITSWNPAAERLFGYSEMEAIGNHISLIIPPDRLYEEEQIIESISAGNKIDHFETIRTAKDGTMIPISASISPILNREGKIIGASKIARNLSEQKEASERKGILAAIVDTSDDTILSKTLDGIITSWNKAAIKMFGYTEKEAIGKHVSLIIPPDRLDEENFIIGEVSKGIKVDHFQTFRQAKNGALIPISLSVSPVIDDQGNIIGASKVARDISAEHASQAETKRLYEQLKELNAKKDEFIGLASHELKTPLTSIQAYLQILSRNVTDEKSRIFLDKTQQQVKRLIALISDLLDISKIEAGKLHFEKADFNLCQIIEEAIDLVSHSNRVGHITFHKSASECIVNGDANRIEQVIVNFLTNAIRYSPVESDMDIYLNVESDIIKVGVKDYGIGIAKEQIEHIFSKFFRVDNKNTSGLGIGLHLCNEVIRRHNGKIWVESIIGKGSTFWFTLPAK